MNIFFDSHEIQIYRKRRIGSTHRYGMSATGTVWAADIQPASPEKQQSINGRFGQVYVGFIDADCDIKEGDQIMIQDTGQRYGVKGVGVWRGAGLLDHKELLLVSQDADNG